MPPRKVSDLRFLDWQGEKIALLQRLELHALDQVTRLGDGDPLLVLCLASSNSTGPHTSHDPSPTSVRMPLPNPPRKPLWPPIPGPPGPPGPPTALASSAIWCFLGNEARIQILKNKLSHIYCLSYERNLVNSENLEKNISENNNNKNKNSFPSYRKSY